MPHEQTRNKNTHTHTILRTDYDIRINNPARIHREVPSPITSYSRSPPTAHSTLVPPYTISFPSTRTPRTWVLYSKDIGPYAPLPSLILCTEALYFLATLGLASALTFLVPAAYKGRALLAYHFPVFIVVRVRGRSRRGQTKTTCFLLQRCGRKLMAYNVGML
jgi:hypothetical protein